MPNIIEPKLFLRAALVDHETALDDTDKVRMKAIMHQHGIETSRHISISEFEELKSADLRFPIMIKPADSNSAKGVKKAENITEAEADFELAKGYSRNGMVIAEEFVEGPEISAKRKATFKRVNAMLRQLGRGEHHEMITKPQDQKLA